MKIRLPLILLMFSIGSASVAEELDWTKKYFFHLVEKGENLSQISLDYYGTPVYQDLIQKVNGIANVTQLPIERTLLIPTNNFFLDKAAIEDAVSSSSVFYRKKLDDGRQYIGVHIPQQNPDYPESRRFIIIDISGLDYKKQFDSMAINAAHRDLNGLERLSAYSYIDLDGDGGLDVLGRDKRKNRLTQYAFHHVGQGKYAPYMIIQDRPVAFENHYRDKQDKSLVFVYEPPMIDGMRPPSIVLPWKSFLPGGKSNPVETAENIDLKEVEPASRNSEELPIEKAEPEQSVPLFKTPVIAVAPLPEEPEISKLPKTAQPMISVTPGIEEAPTSDSQSVLFLPKISLPIDSATTEVVEEDAMPAKDAKPVLQKPEPTKTKDKVYEDYKLYTVQPGETLGGIAEREFLTFNNYHLLMAINDMRSPDELISGRPIIIPLTNSYFLKNAELDLRDKRLVFQRYVDKKGKKALVGIASPQDVNSTGCRFVVIDPLIKPFRVVFDSANLDLSKKSAEHRALEFLNEWALGDSDDDGDMDIIGRGIQNVDGQAIPVQIVFRKSWGKFRARISETAE